MTDRRSFLKGLLSSIGGIMIVKPPSIDGVIKETKKPRPPEQSQRMFFGGSSCAMKLTFDIDPSKEPEDDGYVGSYPYPYSNDMPMAGDPFPSGWLTEDTSPEEEKRIRDARREWPKRNIGRVGE